MQEPKLHNQKFVGWKSRENSRTKMGNQQCASSTEENYSAPMPTIGLYIAGATLVCFLFIIFDMVSGYRRRQPWLPCRFFSINSFTLTLLSIATKLPVDLTTPMPGVIDQLSKLCGTLLICICMGFFMPSLGTMKDSELFANMASLSVLVIAVIVNIYMQIATGVIFSHFIVEHVLILTLMWLTLMAMWYVSFNIYWLTERGNDYWRNSLGNYYKGGNMAQGLKHCHFHSYFSNPQLRVCAFTHYATTGKGCTYAPLILLEAVIRTYIMDLKFCQGISDYKWSVWVVLIIQILTIVIGSLAITFRWFFTESSKDPFQKLRWHCGRFQEYKTLAALLINRKIYSLPINFSRKGVNKSIQVLVNVVVYISFCKEIIMCWLDRLATLEAWLVKKLRKCCKGDENENSEIVHMHRKVRGDIGRMVENYEKEPTNNIVRLLSRSRPSLESHSQGTSNNLLLLVLLVRVAAVSIPSEFHELLSRAMGEAFKMVYFIDKRMNSFSFNYVCKRTVASDVWMCVDCDHHWFQQKVIEPLQEKYQHADQFEHRADVDRALQIIEDFLTTMKNIPYSSSTEECCIINDFIKRGRSQSIQELYNRMEQLFVDTMYHIFTRLPSEIFEYVSMSPYAELEERSRTALEFQSKFDMVQAQVSWLLPAVHDGAQVSQSNTPHSPVIEDNDAASVNVTRSRNEDVVVDVVIQNNEIIEVE